jgi:hypothetical protein
MTRRRHTRRRRISNRGGGRLETIARRHLYHNIIPTLTRYNNMYTGEKLRPSHNSVVRHGDRYFNIMERVFDSNPDWASSMKAAEEELKNPVKNFDKLKTLYDKVKKAEDDETRETMIHSSLLPSKSPRSFTDRRNSNLYSHIPNEFMYRKPYDGDDDGDAYRTPAKTRDDDGDDSDDGDDFDMLLQSRKKKNQHHDYLTAHHRRCVHLPLLYPTRTRPV